MYFFIPQISLFSPFKLHCAQLLKTMPVCVFLHCTMLRSYSWKVIMTTKKPNWPVTSWAFFNRKSHPITDICPKGRYYTAPCNFHWRNPLFLLQESTAAAVLIWVSKHTLLLVFHSICTYVVGQFFISIYLLNRKQQSYFLKSKKT